MSEDEKIVSTVEEPIVSEDASSEAPNDVNIQELRNYEEESE